MGIFSNKAEPGKEKMPTRNLVLAGALSATVAIGGLAYAREALINIGASVSNATLGKMSSAPIVQEAVSRLEAPEEGNEDEGCSEYGKPVVILAGYRPPEPTSRETDDGVIRDGDEVCLRPVEVNSVPAPKL